MQLSASNENPTESVSFAFQAVEVAYRPEKDDGSLDGAIPKGYDLESLTPGFAAPSASGCVSCDQALSKGGVRAS